MASHNVAAVWKRGEAFPARRFYLVVGINKPLSCRVVLVGSSPQNAGSLVYNWSVALAEARADSDSSRVYLPLPRVPAAAVGGGSVRGWLGLGGGLGWGWACLSEVSLRAGPWHTSIAVQYSRYFEPFKPICYASSSPNIRKGSNEQDNIRKMRM
jgi:hypothetical protein